MAKRVAPLEILELHNSNDDIVVLSTDNRIFRYSKYHRDWREIERPMVELEEFE